MTTQVHIICTSLNLSLNFKNRFETLKPRFENFNFERKSAHLLFKLAFKVKPHEFFKPKFEIQP